MILQFMGDKILNTKNILIALIYFFPISILFGNFVINFNLLLCSIIFLFLFIKHEKFKSYFSIELLLLFLFIFINTLTDFILDRPNSFKSLGLLRFLLFGLCINYFFSNNLINKIKYQKYILLIIFFVCIDAIIQSLFGSNLLGIKKEAVYLSGVFGEEKILGSYVSKILIFSLPFLFEKFNIKKFSFLILIFFIILQTTERTGLFIFLTSSLIFFFISEINLRIKIFSLLASFFILILILISFESLKLNILYKSLHQFGFEKINKKIILLVHDECKIKNAFDENLLCAERRYDNIKKQLGLHDLKVAGNFGIFSQNHIAHILVSLKIWNDYKFFGIGVNNFRYYSYDDTYELDNELYNKIKASTHPHNIYAQILVETGIVGFVIFFSSLIIIISKRLKNVFYEKKKNKQNISFLIILIIFILPIPTGNIFGTSHGLFLWTYLILNINLISSPFKKSKQ